MAKRYNAKGKPPKPGTKPKPAKPTTVRTRITTPLGTIVMDVPVEQLLTEVLGSVIGAGAAGGFPGFVGIWETLKQRAAASTGSGAAPPPPPPGDPKNDALVAANAMFGYRWSPGTYTCPTSGEKTSMKAAYRVLVQRHHPDRSGGSAARMAEINAAWDLVENQWGWK